MQPTSADIAIYRTAIILPEKAVSNKVLVGLAAEEEPEEEGSAEEGRENAHGQFGRRENGSGHSIAQHQKDTAEKQTGRHEPAMVRAEKQAADVRTHKSDEANGTAHGDDPTDHDTDRKEEDGLYALHRHAAAGGEIFAGGEKIKFIGVEKDDKDAENDGRQYLKNAPHADCLESAHEPTEDAEGVVKIGSVLNEEDEAGEEKIHRHTGQEHGSGGEAALDLGESIDKDDGPERADKGGDADCGEAEELHQKTLRKSGEKRKRSQAYAQGRAQGRAARYA